MSRFTAGLLLIGAFAGIPAIPVAARGVLIESGTHTGRNASMTGTLTAPAGTMSTTPPPTGTVTALPTASSTPTSMPTTTATATTSPTRIPTGTPTPRAGIFVSPSSTSPGQVVTVSGGNFARYETIRVGLDRSALAVAHADAQGLLPPVQFVVPLVTTRGRHAIFAVGLMSHRYASRTLTVNAPVARLRLDHASAGIGTVLCATGTSYRAREKITVSLNGNAVKVVMASALGSFTACFTTPGSVLAGRNMVTAVGTASHASASATFTGILTTASTFYFVGADTHGDHTTDLAIANPQGAPADLTLRFYLPFTGPFDRAIQVPAHARSTIALGPYVTNVAGFSVRVQSNRVIAAQMVVYRGDDAPYTLMGSGLLQTQWYLPEGFTGLTFHETIGVVNPNAAPATLQLRLLPAAGGNQRVTTFTVPADESMSIDVNKLFPHASVAAIVNTDIPVSVVRIMTFGVGGYGATADGGAASAATTWYFAEGSTANGFQTFLTVLNPGRATATVRALLYDTSGRLLGGRTIRVGPDERGTMRLNDTVRASSLATIVTSDAPVVVERPLYLGNPNSGRTGGTLVLGRNGTSADWIFPAGDTASDREFILVLNTDSHALPLKAIFYLTNGQEVSATYTVPANARLTLNVNTQVPGLPASLHSAQLVSTNGRGFIAEQSIYNESLTYGYGTAGLAQ